MRATSLKSASPQAAPPRPLASVADVDILAQLALRPRRAPDYSKEHEAFVRLTATMTVSPRGMLQELAAVGVDLCGADTAGVSLLDGEVFRWEAVAGMFASARGGTMPRDQSPCGVCIDRNATQLMHLPERCFPALPTEPRLVEAMLIPFHIHGEPVGTVWIVSHRAEKTFDREDERIMQVLSGFASAGWQMWKATEALERANARKEEFVATLGHELRSPLGVIGTAATVLRGNVPEGSAALDLIARQLRHATHLLDDLLDVARVNSGKLTLTRARVDLRAIVEQCVEGSRLRGALRQHDLTVSLGSTPVTVDADAVRLAQVVTNLVENAVKYTPPQGSISVSVSVWARHAALVVRDNGIGLPPDSLEEIFEPFVQLASEHHGANGGLGLGLPLVRKVVELHGGTVRAASPGPRLGSCFTVQLPLHHDSVPAY